MKFIWLHRVAQRDPAEELVHVRHAMSSKSIDQPVGTAAGCHAATIAKPVRIERIANAGQLAELDDARAVAAAVDAFLA
jgi:hypothetical protein